MALNEILAPGRITRAAPAVEDIRENPGEFVGISRVPFVPAENGDILARVSARQTAGDIYPDGAPAVVRAEPPLQLVPVAVANFKRATPLTPSDLDLAARIIQGESRPGLFRTFGEYVQQRVRRNRMGNYMRLESAIWGMWLDSYTYTANGTLFTVNWGKPSDLKVTPGTAWTDTAATPVTSIMALKNLASDKYGVTYDHMIMSTTAFGQMVATTQFQAQASVYSSVTFGASNVGFPGSNTGLMLNLAGLILGMTIEIQDHSMPVEANAGTVSTVKYLPANKVLLCRKSDFGNTGTWDFANGTVLESMVAEIVGNTNGRLIGGFDDGMTRGPVTFAVGDFLGATVEIHDVIRGFPRSHNTAATAVLTVAA